MDKELFKRATKLYYQLKSVYNVPYQDISTEDNLERLEKQVDYYSRNLVSEEKVFEILRKYTAERELAIFTLLLSLKAGVSEERFLYKIRFAEISMSGFKIKLFRLIENKFWLQELGSIKLRPYERDQT